MLSSESHSSWLPIRFGNLHEKNLEQLKRLNLSVFPIKYGERFYEEVLQAPPGLVKLAYYHDFLIGAYCCRKEIGSDKQPKIYILTIGVLAPYRERGVGSQLLQQILQLPKTERFKDITEIYAHVQTSNEAALGFYQKHGFQIGEKKTNYYRDIDPPDCYVVYKKYTNGIQKDL
ncbi:GCN5-related N-acetyltransferase (GNAT) family protein [Galdieria sulphuraria]|uniref:GCN5-related N-acetyltransferase (GNAT) family protein n=1 Tax=Galdieria sulphuraria TaxID=130081 RepID=M2W7X6_GALSU|nr:GCN5-related N-acetyltransferase (GNAT) family protein [Galdieria sulphuraria]EME31936.1 GCN5-related N-acetyltransferase (GNAT) family protein [Galdieria sulphuraria]|eukprot:XP_005708456.1 GCN5-related N-acetyltransferase (GNAT) family protein [Galdieria sulphuraria]